MTRLSKKYANKAFNPRSHNRIHSLFESDQITSEVQIPDDSAEVTDSQIGFSVGVQIALFFLDLKRTIRIAYAWFIYDVTMMVWASFAAIYEAATHHVSWAVVDTMLVAIFVWGSNANLHTAKHYKAIMNANFPSNHKETQNV